MKIGLFLFLLMRFITLLYYFEYLPEDTSGSRSYGLWPPALRGTEDVKCITS